NLASKKLPSTEKFMSTAGLERRLTVPFAELKITHQKWKSWSITYLIFKIRPYSSTPVLFSLRICKRRGSLKGVYIWSPLKLYLQLRGKTRQWNMLSRGTKGSYLEIP